MKIDEGVNWKIHGKLRQMLNSKAKSQTCDHSKNPISFSTKLCLSCPRIPYKVLLTAECWHYQFFINSEKSHLWRWVIIVSRILFYILVFWPNQSKMTIHNIVNDVTKNWIQWKQETDVDINYQHFDFFLFQTVLNGILMVCFTTRSFAKKILSTNVSQKKEEAYWKKKHQLIILQHSVWKYLP